MPTSIIHMFAAGNGGSENGIASIIIPTDGRISKVAWDIFGLQNADQDRITAELAFVSTSQHTVHDSRGTISTVTTAMGLLTSGGAQIAKTFEEYFEDLRVSSGERVYMHLIATAGLTSVISCNLHFESGSTRRRLGRRS